ncbi:hypothetical protein BCR44DRAFT_258168 [Catenaria anguillulae PL171]|uniref:Uncharacterized protein n=1 Tax=Catenaria anguillulae PL171 TaxID=765915 RepID=A0A1Y2HKN7_9FUNG|nr:hypothetical protein BCR44DRAFT_258168 [Catenaria anguillulae PL171]
MQSTVVCSSCSAPSVRACGGSSRRTATIHLSICLLLFFLLGSTANYLTYVLQSHRNAMPATLLFTFIHSTIPSTKALVGRQGALTSSRASGKRSVKATPAGGNHQAPVVAASSLTSSVGRGSVELAGRKSKLTDSSTCGRPP